MLDRKTTNIMKKRVIIIRGLMVILFALLVVRIGTIMVRKIPVTEISCSEAKDTVYEKIPYKLERTYKFEVTQEERMLLEFITFAEAGTTENLVGQVAIAAEVLNRWEDATKNSETSPFPSTIKEILWQKGQYYDGYPMWYSPSGYRKVTENDVTNSVRQAVELALQGADPTEKELGGYGAYFHYSPKFNNDTGKNMIIDQLEIGNHMFYSSWEGYLTE